MTIYLTHGGGGEAKVDEIQDKLTSTIPDLKRVPSVEDVDRQSPDRSIILLVATPPHDGNLDHLIDVVRRNSPSLFFIIVGGDISARDYKRLIQFGNADWVAEIGLPHEVLDIVGRVNAPMRHEAVPAEIPDRGVVHAKRGRRR